MQAIKEAIAILRATKGTPAEIGRAWIVADELEALLKHEPIGHVVNASRHPNTDSTFTNVLDSNVKIPVGLSVYADPRPPCDLKALATEVRNRCYQRLCDDAELDAIIAKHMNGGK